MLIGIAYWKAVALPTVLHRINAINKGEINEWQINKLEITENNVYLKVLKASSYMPVVALRGKNGSSEAPVC